MRKFFFEDRLTRKEFLKETCIFCLGMSTSISLAEQFFTSEAFAAKDNPFYIHEAKFYKKIDDKTVQCELCPKRCRMHDGHRSFCKAREPKDGKLYSLVYAKACAVHIDPVEKKPLFHFLPGTQIFSIATAGCNYRCKFCQNWQISQFGPEETVSFDLFPQDVLKQTIKNNCPSIAYTYTEPSIFYEYMLDTIKLSKPKGIKNIYHSNGSLNPAPVEELSLYLDAANIDLKGFTQSYYQDVCAGDLDVVLNTIKTLKKNGLWVELTNLIIPTLNDDFVKIKEMCIWIKENVGPDVPIHFSRFWPQYKLTNLVPTPVETLEKARLVAQEAGLNFAYIGNIPGHPAESTYCPVCKKIVIQRQGYSVLSNNIVNGKCKFCGKDIPGVWG